MNSSALQVAIALALATLRFVGVLRAVDRGEDVFARLDGQAGGDGVAGCVVRGHLFRGLDDRVASQQDAVIGHALTTQIPDGLLGGCAMQVGQDADDPAVEFLRRGPVVRSQPRLHMHDGAPA